MKFQQMLELVYAQAEGVPVAHLPCYQGAWDTLESYTRGDIVVDEEIAWKALQNMPARILMKPADAPDFWKPIRVMNAALLKTVPRLWVMRIAVQARFPDTASSSLAFPDRPHYGDYSYTAYTRLPLVDALMVLDSFSDVVIDTFNIQAFRADVISFTELDDMEDDSIAHAGGFLIEEMPTNRAEMLSEPEKSPVTAFLLSRCVTYAGAACQC